MRACRRGRPARDRREADDGREAPEQQLLEVATAHLDGRVDVEQRDPRDEGREVGQVVLLGDDLQRVAHHHLDHGGEDCKGDEERREGLDDFHGCSLRPLAACWRVGRRIWIPHRNDTGSC